MKTKKLLLDFGNEDEEILIGLVRIIKKIPDYELFYHVNSINTFRFSRIDDFVYNGNYYDYFFPRFECFHSESKICIHFIANKSVQYFQKRIAAELFGEEQETKFLLPHYQDVDYLVRTSEPFDDFSLILLPENLFFSIQHYSLSSDDELYPLIQYYE